MRLDLLEEHGGMYVDHDAFVLRSLDDLRHCTAVRTPRPAHPLTAEPIREARRAGPALHRRAVPRRLFAADPQILAHPVDGEAEIEFVPNHRVAAIDHLP